MLVTTVVTDRGRRPARTEQAGESARRAAVSPTIEHTTLKRSTETPSCPTARASRTRPRGARRRDSPARAARRASGSRSPIRRVAEGDVRREHRHRDGPNRPADTASAHTVSARSGGAACAGAGRPATLALTFTLARGPCPLARLPWPCGWPGPGRGRREPAVPRRAPCGDATRMAYPTANTTARQTLNCPMLNSRVHESPPPRPPRGRGRAGVERRGV